MVKTPEEWFRYCPRCGARGFRNPRPRLMACAVCGWQFYLNPAAAAVGVIRNAVGEVLFTTRAHDPGKGMLDLPGGFVDCNESAEQALRRELREELGFEAGPLKHLGCVTNRYPYKGILYHTLDFVFETRCADDARFGTSDEVTDFIFADPARVKRAALAFDSVRAIVATMLGGLASSPKR